MKISIIIPVYNVEKYLAACLNSILHQTFINIEIILVNDGSKDSSGAICDEYVLKDNRIKVLHIPNGGVAKAREYGVNNSTGEYVIFVDADDWIPENAIELLSNHISGDYDIIIGSPYYFYEKDDTTVPFKLRDEVLSQKEFLKEIISQRGIIEPWCKLFKRSLFTEHSFPVLKRGQDILMNIEIGCNVKSVKCIPYYVYFYRSGSSTSSSKSHVLSFDFYFTFCSIMSDTLQRFGLFDQFKIDYALLSLKIIFNTLQKGENTKFDSNHVWVKEVVGLLNGEKLSLVDRLKVKSLKSVSVRHVVRFIYSNRISNSILRLRSKAIVDKIKK